MEPASTVYCTTLARRFRADWSGRPVKARKVTEDIARTLNVEAQDDFTRHRT